MATVIGIDLGTTNSCASYVKDGALYMVPSRSGAVIVPSVLNLDEKGNLCVGQQAKRRFVTSPGNTIYGAKRLMGRRFDSNEMVEIQKHFYYDIGSDADGSITIKVEDKEFTLEDISALILGEIKETAQEHLEERIKKVVISVPAYFNNPQRESVRKAAESADLEVLRIINEPTAAALAYGFGKKNNQRILVYDLGGGTFDVTVLHLYEEVYEVIATGGDSFLGGIDFDNLVVEYLLDRFEKKEGISLRDDAVALQRIRDAAERAKIDLSAISIAVVSLPFLTMRDGEPVTLEDTISRKEYQELVEPLIIKTFRMLEKVLLEANITKDDIDDILLVGGMTRMPLVQEYVTRYFGRKPRKDVHPDEVVAQGAAILADALEKGGGGVVLRDVLPVSIGMRVSDQFRKLINKNTTLPTKMIKRFKTSMDSQPAVRLQMYQGESRELNLNEYLGELVLEGLSSGPAGSVEVLVAFLIDDDGVLKVRAKERGTNRVIKAAFETRGTVQRESYRADQILSEDDKEPKADKKSKADNVPKDDNAPKGSKKSLWKKFIGN